MTYTSLQSPADKDYLYDIRVAHLYGNLLNTYGDNGNVLMLKYVGEKLGIRMTFDIVSIGDDFDANKYDMVFFGGGQDYEQSIVAKDCLINALLLPALFKIIRLSQLSAAVSSCWDNIMFKPMASALTVLVL